MLRGVIALVALLCWSSAWAFEVSRGAGAGSRAGLRKQRASRLSTLDLDLSPLSSLLMAEEEGGEKEKEEEDAVEGLSKNDVEKLMDEEMKQRDLLKPKIVPFKPPAEANYSEGMKNRLRNEAGFNPDDASRNILLLVLIVGVLVVVGGKGIFYQ
mmetsp:Transcript_55355/g.108358  ORF Transcript_55355/g.108358 Transcript_55355/m.108358 type:complete len:155 (+) Transcript_55355:203-667(+)